MLIVLVPVVGILFLNLSNLTNFKQLLYEVYMPTILGNFISGFMTISAAVVAYFAVMKQTNVNMQTHLDNVYMNEYKNILEREKFSEGSHESHEAKLDAFNTYLRRANRMVELGHMEPDVDILIKKHEEIIAEISAWQENLIYRKRKFENK